MENNINIDYNTCNLAFDTIINGEAKKIFAPPPPQEDINVNVLTLGDFFEKVQKSRFIVLARDYKAHIKDILETQAIIKFENIETDTAKRYIEQGQRNIEAMLERILMGSYIINGSEVKSINELKLDNNIKSMIKGYLLVFIVILRYVYTTSITKEINALGLSLTSLSAMEYANTLKTPIEDKETSGK